MQIKNRMKTNSRFIMLVSVVLWVGIWGCQNEINQVQPSTGANSNRNSTTKSTQSNLDSNATKTDSTFITEDWKDDTIRLGEKYDLVRFVEIVTDETGELVRMFDKKLSYKDGKLQNSYLGDLVYNTEGQVTTVLEGPYFYRPARIFSDATYDSRGWLVNAMVGSPEFSFVGRMALYISNTFDDDGKLKANLRNGDTTIYYFSKGAKWPEKIIYTGINAVFYSSYKYITKDSLTYHSDGSIDEIYKSSVSGPTSTSSLNFHSPKFELTSKTEYSGYPMGKAAKFMIWYDLTVFESLYNYIYLPPNIIEMYNKGNFFSYRKMRNDYTLDQSTFKTNSKGDVVEIKRVKTQKDGKKFNEIQRFKYGNI